MLSHAPLDESSPARLAPRKERWPSGTHAVALSYDVMLECTEIGTDMVTVERLHELVDALPEAEREVAARLLETLLHAAPRPAVPGTIFFAGSTGDAVLRPDVPPIASIDELQGDFWPEDEGPDDFVIAVRAWRREGRDG